MGRYIFDLKLVNNYDKLYNDSALDNVIPTFNFCHGDFRIFVSNWDYNRSITIITTNNRQQFADTIPQFNVKDITKLSSFFQQHKVLSNGFVSCGLRSFTFKQILYIFH